MDFKARELQDREHVFLELHEFGAPVTIDGKALTAVVDSYELGDRDLAMGLPSSGLRVFAKTEDMPRRKQPGDTVDFNSRSYVVESWKEDMGMSEVQLVRAQ